MQRRPLATPADVAEYTGVPVRTLSQWRWQRDRGPRWLKIEGGRIRYRWSDVEHWLDEQATGGGKGAA